jgi:hypothetical protein
MNSSAENKRRNAEIRKRNPSCGRRKRLKTITVEIQAVATQVVSLEKRDFKLSVRTVFPNRPRYEQ